MHPRELFVSATLGRAQQDGGTMIVAALGEGGADHAILVWRAIDP